MGGISIQEASEALGVAQYTVRRRILVYTVLYRGIAFVALVIYNSIVEGRRTLLATKPTLMGQFE